MRCLAAELLARTVRRLFPTVLLIEGGSNSLGFFYDFAFEQLVTEGLVDLIENQLRSSIKEGDEVHSISMMRENAQAFFLHHDQPLLAYQAAKASENILSLVQIGDFYGLCPPLAFTSTQEAGHIKLLSCQTFSRWIGDEEKRVTRFIGATQKTGKDLKHFLKSYDLFLKKKDHRLLGSRLNLFSFSELMGELGTVWHPKGMALQQVLRRWVEQLLPEKELEISTPLVVRQSFLQREVNTLAPFVFEGENYQLSPSPLQQHLTFLNNFPLNSEDLPWKITEYAAVYQHFPEPQRWGLLGSCHYVTDQTTICCPKTLIIPELISSLHFIEQIIKIFGFEANWYLAAARQKTPKARQEQEGIEWLKQAIQAKPCIYPLVPQLQEEDGGKGPRLELRVLDVLGREWSLSALSIMQHVHEAQAFHYPGVEGQPPLVVFTRHLWGSLDRFIGLLVERYEGSFPLWLAPEQVRVIGIGEADQIYAKHVHRLFQQKGLRAKLDMRSAKLSARVHEAEKENVPYLVLIGEQERLKQKISVRFGPKADRHQFVELEEFLDKLYRESLCPNL